MPEEPEQTGAAADPLTAAITAWQSAHATLGPHHESTLTALLAVASARWGGGDSLGAVHDAGDVWAARRDLLGDEHPDTLVVAGLVAMWRYHRGDEGAVGELRELVPVMARVLGAEQADTLWATHTVATAEEAGDDPARRLLRWVQLAAAETRVFGARHELTLSALYGVALARHDLGDVFGASTDALIVVGYRRRLLGEHHPHTLAAQLSRLTWMGEAGAVNDHTLNEFDDLIVALQNTLGHDHEQALLARYYRALWTPDTANEIERISQWEVLAEDLERTLGEQHPVSVDAAQRLAVARAEWEVDLDDFRGLALDLLIDLESEHRDVELEPGRGYMQPGNLDDDAQDKVAEDADEQRSERADLMEHTIEVKKALGRSARALGNEHLDVLQWRYYLAWWLWNGHEFDAAGQQTQKLIDDCVRLLGEDHALTGATRALDSHITNRVWGGILPFWDGGALVT